MQTTIPQLSVILQNLLIHDANEIGRQSGFIQRQRKLSGSSFAQGMLFGWQANPNASLEELCQSLQVCGVRISPQGLQERLNSPQAATFLRQLLFEGLSYLVHRTSPRDDLLEQFSGVVCWSIFGICEHNSQETKWRLSQTHMDYYSSKCEGAIPC